MYTERRKKESLPYYQKKLVLNRIKACQCD